MSNIFNLLGEIAESDRNQIIKPIARSKTYEIRPSTHKAMEGTKLKGLSMRSNSDMNISHNICPVNTKKSVYNNNGQDSLKLKVTQIDNNGYPISPGKGTPAKKLIAQSTKCKGLAVQEERAIDKSTKTQKIPSNDIFKKPLPPKRFIKKFPEPENLERYYDNQHEFDHGYINAIEREFKDQMLKKKENITPYDERELISDSDTLISSEIPKFILPSFDSEYIELSSPKLSEISDNEDFEW